jgi:hypothetical protein
LFSDTTALPTGLGKTNELYLDLPGGDAYAFRTATGSADFTTVSLPSTATASFTLHLLDGTPDQTLSPGETLALNDVTEFELIGDPSDLVLGVSFGDGLIGPLFDAVFTASTITVSDAPEPGTLDLLGAGMLGLGVLSVFRRGHG